MRRTGIRIILLGFMILMGVQGFAQTFTVDVPKVVSMGETFRLVFSADGEPTAPPTFPNLNSFDVLAGPTSSTMSSTQIINGKTTQSFQVSYTYVLEAKTPGRYTINPATAVIKGKTCTTPSITIEVIKGDDNSKSSEKAATSQNVSSNDIFMRMSISKSRVFKGEHLIATLKLYTKVPIAGFEDVKFPTFNGFWSQEIDTPQSIEFQRESVDGKIYNSALIRRYMLIPQQTGPITIDASEMICQVQVKSASRGQSVFDDFFDSYQTVRKRLTAPAQRIVVDPLPAGAPQSFTGAVGDFSMTAKLNKDSVNANEAVSMIITVSGTGNINLVEAPKFTLPAEFEAYDVKITDNSRNSGKGISGSKQYEYPFIPRKQGEYKLPSVEFSYFDISKKRYVTISSGEVVLKVGKDVGGGAQIQGLPASVNKQAVRSLNEDIRYIVTGNSGLSRGNQFFFGSIWYFLILLLILSGSLFADKFLAKHIERSKDVAGIKNKRALKVAKARLKKAELLLGEKRYSDFYEELHRAILGYCSDKLALQMADMSKENIKLALVARGINESSIDELVSIIDSCEFARYAPDPGNGEMQKNYDRAIALISSLEV
ncbi:MAG: BatD family protein [Bacteroidales bacterium]